MIGLYKNNFLPEYFREMAEMAYKILWWKMKSNIVFFYSLSITRKGLLKLLWVKRNEESVVENVFINEIDCLFS